MVDRKVKRWDKNIVHCDGKGCKDFVEKDEKGFPRCYHPRCPISPKRINGIFKKPLGPLCAEHLSLTADEHKQERKLDQQEEITLEDL